MKVLDLTDALGNWYPVLFPLLGTKEMMYIGQVLGRDIDRLQPNLENVFRAFKLTPPDKVKAVIIGQDPYPGGHANGLAFGSGNGDIPWSLDVIMQALHFEYGKNENGEDRVHPLTFDITLEHWAEQGVLLLNRNLTTIKGAVNYHNDIGWEMISGAALKWVAENIDCPVFMSWGQYAKETVQQYVLYNDGFAPAGCYVIYAPHPSAQRHGWNFIERDQFRKCNDYLIAHNKTPIQWIND